MDGLDSELIENFLPSDFDLTANLFEDEFMLEQITADNPQIDLNDDDRAIHGIMEDLESWTGGSSVSSSPTFSNQQNGFSPPASDSDEEKYLSTDTNPYDFLRDVVVDQKTAMDTGNRDTPSPGSTSSSSGCFSDFSTATNDTNIYLASPGSGQATLPIMTQIPPQQLQLGYPLQFVQIPASTSVQGVASKPIQSIQPKAEAVNKPKTVVLSPQDFGQLVKNMKVTKAAPRIQTIVRQPTIKTPIVVPAQVPVQNKIVATKPVSQPVVFTPNNQLVDEKTFKKQQRLIRNRESANASRKKKKEFVDSLQETIDQLGAEKEQLVNENNQLRTQLLNNICSRCSQSIQDVTLKGGQRKAINGYVTKKNSMLVLAMILTVSLNFGPLNNMLSSPSAELSLSRAQSSHNGDVQLRRHILWALDESLKNDSNTQNNSTKPLHRSIRSVPVLDDPTVISDNATKNTTSSKCTTEKLTPDSADQQQHIQYINQTENIRIASELHRWIGEPEYLNVTRKRPSRLSPILSSLDVEDVQKNFEYDGNYLVNLMPKKYLKNRKLQLRKTKKMERFPMENRRTVEQEEAGQVDVFKGPRRGEMKYAELLKELRRRDDTFYVVSFNADHLMLPALAYNKTKRPKMSLMFPAVGFNGTIEDDHIMMMQIDCEVLDTSMIQVKEKLIPDHLKRFQNATAADQARSGDEEEEGVRGSGLKKMAEERNITQEFGPQLKRSNGSRRGGLARKPYFVENPRFGNVTAEGG